MTFPPKRGDPRGDCPEWGPVGRDFFPVRIETGRKSLLGDFGNGHEKKIEGRGWGAGEYSLSPPYPVDIPNSTAKLFRIVWSKEARKVLNFRNSIAAGNSAPANNRVKNSPTLNK